MGRTLKIWPAALLEMFALFALFAAPAIAHAQAMPKAEARLVPATNTPASGATVDLAVVIDVSAGWHIYWQNPGDTGYPPRFDWHLPAGVSIGPARFPSPRRMVLGGIAMNVLSGRVVLLHDMHLDRGLTMGKALPVGSTLDLLVCSEQSCVPQNIDLQTTLRVGHGEHDPAAAAVIAQAQAALPQSLSAQATPTPDGKGITLHLPIAGDHLMVFAAQADGGALSTPQITSTQDGTDLTLSPAPKLVSGQLSLVVTQTDAQGAPVKAWQMTTQPMAAPAHMAFPPGLLAFGAAVIGGLLLNLMPCVFPILSLKAMALVRAGADEAQAKVEALGYLVGACATMMALGAMVLTLRASGEAVGWAFQLQNPAVMAVLVLLVTGIALNMAGLFEVPGLSVSMQRRSGFAGGCGTGALAAFIATPCTGPFMAGALGAALVLPTVQAMAVFAGLGFGLSLPFLVIGWWKPARRLMPAPGNWMVSLRHLLALPMFATAAGLVWLVGQQGGVNAMALALAASVLLGVGLWWMGLRQRGGHAMWPALPVCGLAIGLAVVGVGMMPATAPQTTSSAQTERYSPQRLAQLQSEHRPVLLYATAQWCLTCKVNEATSLSSMSVQTAMRQHGAVLMEADWTRPTPEVTQLLTAHGRAGVPLYLWYGRNGSLQTLPQILTPAMIADLVSRG